MMEIIRFDDNLLIEQNFKPQDTFSIPISGLALTPVVSFSGFALKTDREEFPFLPIYREEDGVNQRAFVPASVTLRTDTTRFGGKTRGFKDFELDEKALVKLVQNSELDGQYVYNGSWQTCLSCYEAKVPIIQAIERRRFFGADRIVIQAMLHRAYVLHPRFIIGEHQIQDTAPIYEHLVEQFYNRRQTSNN